jgi:hypothetical protein
MNNGLRFARWGLGLFMFGVLLTFGVIAHYCVGARWPTGELFMQNITLWWACPWTLSVAAVQAGGLGMVAIGLTMALMEYASLPLRASGLPLFLCVTGLLGVFGVGYAGYFVFDAIWPSFYYSPISKGKNVWLIGQALFIFVYFSGILVAFRALPQGTSVERQIA